MKIQKPENIKSFTQELEAIAGTAVIKFEAEWCSPCKAMASVVEEMALRNPEVRFFAVDIEEEGAEELIDKFGVRCVPTFVKLEDGAEVKSAGGTLTKAEFSSFLERC